LGHPAPNGAAMKTGASLPKTLRADLTPWPILAQRAIEFDLLCKRFAALVSEHVVLLEHSYEKSDYERHGVRMKAFADSLRAWCSRFSK
jgi:hypothetical protein